MFICQRELLKEQKDNLQKVLTNGIVDEISIQDTNNWNDSMATKPTWIFKWSKI